MFNFFTLVLILIFLLTIWCISYSRERTLLGIFSLNVVLILFITIMLSFFEHSIKISIERDNEKPALHSNAAMVQTIQEFKKEELLDFMIKNKEKITEKYNENLKEKKKELTLMSESFDEELVIFSNNKSNKDIIFNIIGEEIEIQVFKTEIKEDITKIRNKKYADFSKAVFETYYEVNHCKVNQDKYCKQYEKNLKKVKEYFKEKYSLALNFIVQLYAFYVLFFVSLIFYIHDKKARTINEKSMIIFSFSYLAITLSLFYWEFSNLLNYTSVGNASVFDYIEKKTQWLISIIGLLLFVFPFIIKHVSFKLRVSYAGGRNRVLIFKKDSRWCYCYYYDNRKAYYITENGDKVDFTYQELKEQKFIFEKELYLSENKNYCPFEKVTDENKAVVGIYPEGIESLRYIGNKKPTK